MNVETIIKSLENAENDNKKFALLLILSELIKSKKLDNDEEFRNDRAVNKRLFHSIGAHFLARLITTRQQTSENNYPILYKAVGLSILTQFLDYSELISDPILLTKLDVIINILVESYQDTEESSPDTQLQRDLKLDIFKYLYALSKHCPDYLILNVDLVEILIKEVIFNQKFHREPNTFQATYDFSSQLNGSDADSNNFTNISLQIINNLCQENANKEKNKSYMKLKSEKISKSLLYLVEEINKRQDELFKLKLINYLNYFLQESAINKFLTTDEKMNEKCSNLVFSILNDLFRSKLSSEAKDLAFILLSNFVKLFQFEFIYMKNRNFFYLIIHLLCIQIGLNLENAAELANDSEGSQMLDLTDKVSIYYALLEEVIIILSTASPFDTDDTDETDEENGFGSDADASDKDEDDEIEFKKSEEVDRPEQEMNHAIRVIVECLQAIICFINDTLSGELEKLSPKAAVLIVSSTRVVCCWLSHESLLEQEIVELIKSKLVRFCEHLKKINFEVNAFEFIVSGLQRVLIDQQTKLEEKVKSSSKPTADQVTLEFEKTELRESVESLSRMLESCGINK